MQALEPSTAAISMDSLRIRLPLPPLAEQRRIAAILDQADAAAQAPRSLAQLAQLTQSIFVECSAIPATNAEELSGRSQCSLEWIGTRIVQLPTRHRKPEVDFEGRHSVHRVGET